VNPAKMAEPIEIPFGMWILGEPEELRIRWGPDPPTARVIFEAAGVPIVRPQKQ